MRTPYRSARVGVEIHAPSRPAPVRDRATTVRATGTGRLTTTDEVNGGTMATETRGEAAAKDEGKGRPARKRTTPALFVRQVIAELRKVIWPTRRELITYTTVSLVFVLIMVAIVSGLDWLLQRGVFWAFG
ncbi:hypothetical protein Acsp03_50500 [Actinomadura sp. NBRC 104412]|nr:hypothetical protein Acsp03_50500 [Actinomadura sp. NBRC 104412]